MILRRENLAAQAGWTTDGTAWVGKVRRGESVRIVGLGTLARVDTGYGPKAHVYRLTLTAAVAKSFAVFYTIPSDRWTAEERAFAGPFDDDVRHLARALGAPVEVWAPADPKGTRCSSRLIATVQP